MTEQQGYRPTDDEGKEFARRLREIMGAAVLSVADQAGVELAVAIAQRLDAGEWQLRTTVDLDGDRQPDPSTLRFHFLVEADNGLLELCSAKWTALGVAEESAREEARWTALQNGLGVPDDLPGIGLAFLTGRAYGGPSRPGRLGGPLTNQLYGLRRIS